MLDRRRLLIAGTLTTATGLLPQLPTQGQTTPAPPPRQRPDPLAKDLVESFVRAAHADLERVQTMLEEQPALVNATWDWGGGDWETALGGASHMGRPDIALHLLQHGARMDVFCATMLGQRQVVAAFLAADPGVVHLKGPHGISLLAHARAGGQGEIEELLRAAGAA